VAQVRFFKRFLALLIIFGWDGIGFQAFEAKFLQENTDLRRTPFDAVNYSLEFRTIPV
jgi:hypothetical protein